MSCGVGCRHGSDPLLLWPWCRPGATAPIRPLAWEPPCAAGVALEKAKRQKKEKKYRIPLDLLHHLPYYNNQKQDINNSSNQTSDLIFISLVFPSGFFKFQGPALIQLLFLTGLQPMTVPQSFFIFYDLDFFEEYQAFILWNVPQFGFVRCFSHDQNALVHFWQESRRNAMSLVHRIKRVEMLKSLSLVRLM